MFYSHEILTSRKYGVATVWIVAHLGSRSSYKKVSKQAIKKVDIPKACSTVLEPAVPMALRLQSKLLFGISRVYHEQCSFVLVDAETAQLNMKSLFNTVALSQNLDLHTGKTKSNQLNLRDDPALALDNIIPDLDFDLSVFDGTSLDVSSKKSSSSVKVHTPKSPNAKALKDAPFLDIDSSLLGSGGFHIRDSQVDPSLQNQDLGLLLDDGGTEFDPDIGFEFDAEGNIFSKDDPQTPLHGRSGAAHIRSDSLASAQVRREHEEGRDELMKGILGTDMELPFLDENLAPALPEAEPFPEREENDNDYQDLGPKDTQKPMRKKAASRPILPDDILQIALSKLISWRENYLLNMADAHKVKESHRAPHLAKKNAYHLVFGTGIGGIGNAYPTYTYTPGPLAEFSGDSLLSMLSSKPRLEGSPEGKGKKRSRSTSSADSTTSSQRRTRVRLDSQQLGRGASGEFHPRDSDDGDGSPLLPQPIDAAAAGGIELGRDAPAPLPDDHSSSMPWNQPLGSSSRPPSVLHGGKQPHRRHHRGPSSSASGTGFKLPDLPPGPHRAAAGSFRARRSRIPSSPLHGRGPAREESSGLLPGWDEDNDGELFQLGGGASLSLSSQQQGITQTQELDTQERLHVEVMNFLDFVRSCVAEAAEEGEESGGRGSGGGAVAFEQVLPPAVHEKHVAAQGFVHLLTLASEGWLDVCQEEAYGPIEVRVVGD